MFKCLFYNVVLHVYTVSCLCTDYHSVLHKTHTKKIKNNCFFAVLINQVFHSRDGEKKARIQGHLL